MTAYRPAFPSMTETDQLIAVVGSDQIFSDEIPGKLLLDRLEVLPVVPESPALANRRLVEDVGHPADERIVVAGLPHLDTALLRLADEVPGLRLDLLVPPVIEAL